MDFRRQIKQILRMCGHAAVSTVHERLNNTDEAVKTILDQNNHLARNQTALLQSNIYIVETLKEILADWREMTTVLQHVEQETKESVQCLREDSARIETVAMGAEHTGRVLHKSIVSLQELIVSLQRGSEQRRGVEEYHDQLLQEVAETQITAQRLLQQELVRQICIETSDYAANNPEIGLMQFLYSYLPSRKALDIGAHIGLVSEYLLAAGYEVYAFEPFPPSFAGLIQRLGGNPCFHASNVALGGVETVMPLHLAKDLSIDSKYTDASVFHSLAPHAMPEDLPFGETVPVPVRTLSNLHSDQAIPDDISLVKIDSEGYDLEIVRGMGDRRYPVIGVEYWDTRIPFGTSGLLYTFEDMVAEMRQRGYGWYIVLFRIWGRDQTAFYCNHERPVPESWGNIYFFRDSGIFAAARQWCSAVLPHTYFKPAAV